MSHHTLRFRTSTAVALVLALGLLRAFNTEGSLFSILPFLSPLPAIALFSGARIRTLWLAVLLPLAVLFVSDVLLMRQVYSDDHWSVLYKGWYVVYALFALMALGGRMALSGPLKPLALGSTAIGSALGFWVASNFATWLNGKSLSGLPYEKSWSGLAECYTAALPFLRDGLAGTLLYSFLIFGAYYFITQTKAAKTELANS